MATYSHLKTWRSKKKNAAYGREYMAKRRNEFRRKYRAGKVAYEDIPKAYRCFKDTRASKRAGKRA